MLEQTRPVSVVAKARLGRREFLKGTGVLIGTLWASSSVLIALAPSRVWALELKALDDHAGKALLALIRQIFPHDKLDDAVYALVVKDLDAEAASTPAKTSVAFASLHEPRLVYRGFDERREQRVWIERLRLQLGVELYTDEPGMVRDLDDFG